MKSPASKNRPSLVVLLAFASFASNLSAQEAAGPATTPKSPGRGPDMLVISNGKITGETLNGRTEPPATLRAVLDLLQPRYPEANITVVGADDIVIPNLILRRRAAAGPIIGRPADPSLTTVLAALSVASGRKFEMREVIPNEYLIERTGNSRDSRFPEVFNLTRYINRGLNPGLVFALRETEAELSVLRKNFGEKDPRVVDLKQRQEVIKASLTPRSTQEVENDIARIMEMVDRTLKMIEVSSKPPEVQFHSGTNLLIVVGNDVAVEVVRKIVAALESAP
jgi:hypothetical protein